MWLGCKKPVPLRLGSQGEEGGCCPEPGRMHFSGGKWLGKEISGCCLGLDKGSEVN